MPVKKPTQREMFEQAEPAPVEAGELKRCPRCGQGKGRDQFARNKGLPDGLNTYCRACAAEMNKAWRQGVRAEKRTELGYFRKCGSCDLFVTRPELSTWNSYYCKPCQKVIDAREYATNRAKRQAESRERLRRLRLAVIEGYGGCCECCGQRRWQFLTLDHIHGGGKKHIDEVGGNQKLLRQLRDNGFPRDRIRLLCTNCNCGRRLGECPHKTPLPDLAVQQKARPAPPTLILCKQCLETKDASTGFAGHWQGYAAGVCKVCEAANARADRRARQEGRMLPNLPAGIGYLRRCPSCELWKVLPESFHKDRRKRHGYVSLCKACCLAGRDQGRDKTTHKRYRGEIRRETMIAYGGACQCCGESDWRFLTIDHTEADGARERKNGVPQGTGFYQHLRRLGYPQDRYRCLCFDCNCCIARHGRCAHQEESAT